LYLLIKKNSINTQRILMCHWVQWQR